MNLAKLFTSSTLDTGEELALLSFSISLADTLALPHYQDGGLAVEGNRAESGFRNQANLASNYSSVT